MSDAPSRGIVVLDPTARPVPKLGSRAERLDTLEGKRIGFIDNSKRNSDQVLRRLDTMLHQRYGTADSITIRKSMPSRIVDANEIEQLLGKVDAVIPGVGD
ncbi:MAG: hypothetical protein IT307_13765 [Chloroflexi bacterium]|nr:hypothetical protein [Chloroflexota bacterium]